jgi:PadR family transcriptional regulator, regulatory protein AphA
MDLRATLLGLLAAHPASGYDLKQVITDSEVFYWSGNNNQIYKTLLELQQEGLVTYEVLQQDSLPAKKIYAVTEAVQAELRTSLLAEPELPVTQHDLLIRLSLAGCLADEDLLGILDRYETEVRDRLVLLEGRLSRSKGSVTADARGRHLLIRVAENQIASFRLELEWVRQLRQELVDKSYSTD